MKALRARFGLSAPALAFVAAAGLYPVVFPSDYALGVGITIGLMAIGSVGLVLLLGLAHQLAIGQAAFYMVGGYATGILTTRYGVGALGAAGLGAVCAATLAYLVGYPLLKLRGFVLAIASEALHLVFIAWAVLMVGVTGGSSGIPTVPSFSIGEVKLGTGLAYYIVVWLLVAGTIFVGSNIERSRLGRALRALAADEAAAASSGIDTTRYKLQIFVLSAVMASVGGSAMVHYLRVVDPHLFGVQFSLDLITAVIVGGLTSVWGGVLGATALIASKEVLRALNQPAWEAVLTGALTIGVLIGFPAGLAGGLQGLWERLSPRRTLPMPVPADSTAPIRPRSRTGGADPSGALLELEHVSRSFGNLRAVSELSFTVESGAITALIGPNGAGKTTALDLISGHQALGAGRVLFQGRPIGSLMPDEIARRGVARTFQTVRLFDNMTVMENVMCGHHPFGRAGMMSIALALPRVRVEEARARRAAYDELLFCGIANAAALRPSQLPFGNQRLVEIARALTLDPHLLLLDEPASGLNDTETEALAELILGVRDRGVTVLLVEHDIRLVMGLADKVIVMDRGVKIADAIPDVARKSPQVISAYLGDAA